jgi:[acyl-carrier-protein] S-malonyltransferase
LSLPFSLHVYPFSRAPLQPAIYVASLAAVEKLRATEGQALLDSIDVTCGLSLGEYTALAFAGNEWILC